MSKRRRSAFAVEGGRLQTFKRIGRYTLTRGISIFAALLIGVYLCVLAVNYGGFIDAIFNDLVEGAVMDAAIYGDHSGESYEETSAKLNQMREQLREMYGLNEPFFNRSLKWYWHAITFDWGEQVPLNEDGYFFYDPPIPVRQMILDYLPRSMLLFAAANLTTFLIGIFTAMAVGRKPDGIIYKLVSALTPLFTAPSWVYGLILFIFLPWLLICFPLNDLVDPNLDLNFQQQVFIILKRLAWPVAATFLSMFIQLIFTWRTFFAISASEDHVSLAIAMGLHPRRIEQKYILRPTLLPVITNFSMLLLAFWQSSLALEIVSCWPGIGFLFMASFWRLSRNIIVAIVVTFAYLIAFTVFMLEFVYALVDPRVRITGNQTRKIPRKKTLSGLKGQQSPHVDQGQKLIRSIKKRTTNLRGFKLNSLILPRWRQSALYQSLKRISKSTMAKISLLMVTTLALIAVIVVVKIPMDRAIELWRSQREDTWRTPELAQPTWTNFFKTEKLSETIFLTTADPGAAQGEKVALKNSWVKEITFTIDYQAVDLPQDVKIKIMADYEEKQPFVQILVFTPDGRELELAGFSATSETLYSVGDRIADEFTTANRSYAGSPMVPIFTDPESDDGAIITGEYKFKVIARTFEEAGAVDVEFVLLGNVYGIAGTDTEKHDLAVPLLWGLPVALVFGLAGALLTSIGTMLIAAVGTWFGSWADTLVQRITEINIMIPALPIAMTIYLSVSKSIWVILGILVLLNIFSTEIKNYRAAFLQIKDLPYIEAAQSYGASNFHIIRSYLIPKIYPLLLPRLVFMVPAYVYLEATLAFLGVSGIFIPTWGKMISDGLVHPEAPYWITQPIILLVLTGTAFTMLGIALDKIMNPSLYDV
jgi:peptide/nickel transport system permease protein